MRSSDVQSLAPLIGEWTMEAPGMEVEGVARTVFEYLPGRQFVIQRWEVPHPAAPDGIAVIGWDGGRGSLVQHYFDSRGVVRIYGMTFADHVWKRWRDSPDFSPLNFWQRFEGTFSDDGNVIAARWETSSDEGASWELDFRLTYTKVS